MKIAAVIATCALMLTGTAQAGESVRFITCPIYRDTDAGRKSGCWLGDEAGTGRRFDISRGTSKPDWNHEVLVEGMVAPTSDNPCGGQVLEPVRTSVLPGACTRHMLPAEDFKGNSFVLPRRNLAPLSVARAKPPMPYTDKTFHLYFDFDKSFAVYQYDDFLLDQAITYIRSVPLRRIVVTGWAATDPVRVSGRVLAENPRIARERAARAKEALLRLGVDEKRITERWSGHAKPIDDPQADGLASQSQRRVDIAVFVSPAAAP